MPRNWNRYLEQLREIDDSLYNQKEQFKVGLLRSTTKPKKEEFDEKAEKSKEILVSEKADEQTSNL